MKVGETIWEFLCINSVATTLYSLFWRENPHGDSRLELVANFSSSSPCGAAGARARSRMRFSPIWGARATNAGRVSRIGKLNSGFARPFPSVVKPSLYLLNHESPALLSYLLYLLNESALRYSVRTAGHAALIESARDLAELYYHWVGLGTS